MFPQITPNLIWGNGPRALFWGESYFTSSYTIDDIILLAVIRVEEAQQSRSATSAQCFKRTELMLQGSPKCLWLHNCCVWCACKTLISHLIIVLWLQMQIEVFYLVTCINYITTTKICFLNIECMVNSPLEVVIEITDEISEFIILFKYLLSIKDSIWV